MLWVIAAAEAETLLSVAVLMLRERVYVTQTCAVVHISFMFAAFERG